MKILVTGATGFTGRYFIEAGKAAGHHMVSLNADLEDRDSLFAEVAFVQPEAVVHLAAVSFVGHENVSAFYHVNVIGTLNLLDALLPLQKSVQRILLASSANIYGNCAFSPINETQMPAPVNHYAMSKLAMEHMARTYADRLPIFFVRPFNYTGVGQAASFIIPKLVQYFTRCTGPLEIGNLDIEREFNDVRFVCEVYLRLLERAVLEQTYNVCTGRSVSLKAVIQSLSKMTKHEPVIHINPDFVRSNEVYRLTGDPVKLNSVVGKLDQPSLQDTLCWMYEHAVKASCILH